VRYGARWHFRNKKWKHLEEKINELEQTIRMRKL
jgi:hypothetical protein